ncbi:hypothetical protein JL09_g6950, partial [Pichia kudriavzevii]
GIKEGPD